MAMTKLNFDKFCFFMYISICVQGLNKFLKFFFSKFHPGDCSQLVLNFWANLSLGVLIKFVLIKKKRVYISSNSRVGQLNPCCPDTDACKPVVSGMFQLSIYATKQ